MDAGAARHDMEELQNLLECKSSKSKNMKDKADEYRITFENLEQYPYVMWQSTWELDWDKVQALYNLCIGIPAFIVDDSVVVQWSPTASSSSP